MRNHKIKSEVRDEQIKVVNGKIECQVFHSRSPHTPEVLLFHPYDSHLAVSCKDNFRYVTF